MPYNLLLLPLLGGFLFLRWWNPTRYHALRAEKERLLILAAIPGLVSLIVAFAIVSGLGSLLPCASWPRIPCFPAWWESNVPFDYSGTSLLAFALGASLWWPLNFVCSRDKAIDRVIEEDKVPFELLLKKAQDNGNTVAVTMSNGKVYVGYVLHIINPAFPTQFIQILPTKSGYRDEKDKTYHFKNFYSEALDEIDRDFDSKYAEFEDITNKIGLIVEEYGDKPQSEIGEEFKRLNTQAERLSEKLDEIALEADAFGIVLPVAEIMSINIFSEYIYSKYFAPPPEEDDDEEEMEEVTPDPDNQQKVETIQKDIDYIKTLSDAELAEYIRNLKEKLNSPKKRSDLLNKSPQTDLLGSH